MKVELEIKDERYEIRKGVYLSTGENIVIRDYCGVHSGAFLNHRSFMISDPCGGPSSDIMLRVLEENGKVQEHSEFLAGFIARKDKMVNWRFFGVGDGPELNQECIFFGGIGNTMLYMVKGKIIDIEKHIEVSRVLNSDIDDILMYLNSDRYFPFDSDRRRKFYIYAPCVSEDGKDMSLELLEELKSFLVLAK